jgi:hypothetical protein
MSIKRPRLYNTGDRDKNDISNALDFVIKQIDSEFSANQEILDELTTSRLMETDSTYYAYWPCDDAAGATVVRQAIAGGPAPLICSSAALPGAYGYVQEKCLRIYDDGTPANRLATVTPSNPSMSVCSIALWCRLGRSEAAARNVFEWRDSTFGDHTGIRLSSSIDFHIPVFMVTVGGVLYTATVPGEGYLSAGDWHHLGLTYDGETLTGYVDGNALVTNTTPSGAISWSTGAGTKSWRVGTAAADGQSGFYADIRVVSGILPAAWFAEAYQRGTRRFYG